MSPPWLHVVIEHKITVMITMTWITWLRRVRSCTRRRHHFANQQPSQGKPPSNPKPSSSVHQTQSDLVFVKALLLKFVVFFLDASRFSSLGLSWVSWAASLSFSLEYRMLGGRQGGGGGEEQEKHADLARLLLVEWVTVLLPCSTPLFAARWLGWCCRN